MSMTEQPDFAPDFSEADEWGIDERSGKPGFPNTCWPPAWPGRDRPGATDGSVARPGMVGEYIARHVNGTYTAAPQQQTVSAIVLPPGDWDIQASCHITQTPGSGGGQLDMTGAGFALNPIPAGMTDAMAGLAVPEVAPVPGFANAVMMSPRVQGTFAQPTLLAFQLNTNAGGSATAGTFDFFTTARRMR